MNNQEVFNNVWKWFVVEKHERATDDKSCSYYINDDKRCAIGCLLPSDMAMFTQRAYGGATIVTILDRSEKIRDYFKGVDKSLLHDLQKAHDYSSFAWMENISDRLRKVAYDYELEIPS